MSHKIRSGYKFLNHLREGNIFYLVEIDMRELVSSYILNDFYPILKPRAKKRNQLKQRDDQYHKYVKKM